MIINGRFVFSLWQSIELAMRQVSGDLPTQLVILVEKDFSKIGELKIFAAKDIPIKASPAPCGGGKGKVQDSGDVEAQLPLRSRSLRVPPWSKTHFFHRNNDIFWGRLYNCITYISLYKPSLEQFVPCASIAALYFHSQSLFPDSTTDLPPRKSWFSNESNHWGPIYGVINS
jgi:hypothetical protein